MRNRLSWCGLLTLLLLLGCASQEGAAQDEKSGKPEVPKGEGKEGPTSSPTSPATKGNGSAKASKKPKLDPRVYLATVWDRFLKEGQKPFKATEIRLFEPEVSLFGGSAGSESKTLFLQRGAAVIEVPFARLVKIEVGAVEDDRLQVKIEIKSDDPESRTLEGTVKASLELRGRFAKEFNTAIKLREVKVLTLELDPQAPENKQALEKK